MSSIRKVVPALARGSRSFVTGRVRCNTFTPTDAVMDKPHQSKLNHYVFVTVSVVSGMSAGAWMSKNIASFLEENELFVPSDDDDDF